MGWAWPQAEGCGLSRVGLSSDRMGRAVCGWAQQQVGWYGYVRDEHVCKLSWSGLASGYGLRRADMAMYRVEEQPNQAEASWAKPSCRKAHLWVFGRCQQGDLSSC